MDYLAGLILIVGMFLTGYKIKWAWIIQLVGQLIWTYIALQKEIYGLLVVTTFAIIICIHNFIKWSKEDA